MLKAAINFSNVKVCVCYSTTKMGFHFPDKLGQVQQKLKWILTYYHKYEQPQQKGLQHFQF